MIMLQNIENNILIEFQFVINSLLDIDFNRDDFENWLPFILRISTPTRNIIIDESIGATMTVYEIKDFIKGTENLLKYTKSTKSSRYQYCNSENYFEISFEYLNEDDFYELEIWANMGECTRGILYGYDEGLRFEVEREQQYNFVTGLKKDFEKIINNGIV